MALRFQEKDDVERAAREKVRRDLKSGVIFLVFLAAINGAYAFFTNESLASYEKDLAWLVGFVFVYWMLAPFYYEITIRSKEIHVKVSAIEKVAIILKEERADLLRRLAAIEEKLESVREEK